MLGDAIRSFTTRLLPIGEEESDAPDLPLQFVEFTVAPGADVLIVAAIMCKLSYN